MKIYKIASKTIRYHVTNMMFDNIGGKSGVGLHLASSVYGALKFASEWYTKQKFYVMKFNVDLGKSLEVKDMGIFNLPSNFIDKLPSHIINEDEYKILCMQMGAGSDIRKTDYGDYIELGKRDTYFGETEPEEISYKTIDFLKKESISYSEWEPVRLFLSKKGINSIKYFNRIDAGEICYIVFYDSQIELIERKLFSCIKDMQQAIERGEL